MDLNHPFPTGGRFNLRSLGNLIVAPLNLKLVRPSPSHSNEELTINAPSGGNSMTFCRLPAAVSMTWKTSLAVVPNILAFFNIKRVSFSVVQMSLHVPVIFFSVPVGPDASNSSKHSLIVAKELLLVAMPFSVPSMVLISLLRVDFDVDVAALWLNNLFRNAWGATAPTRRDRWVHVGAHCNFNFNVVIFKSSKVHVNYPTMASCSGPVVSKNII